MTSLLKLSFAGLLFGLWGACCSAQVMTTQAVVTDLSARLTYRPQLDSSVNVSTMKLEERNKLIERMYVIDQQYRREIGADVGRQDERAEKAWRFMGVNDRTNQVILLKLLKRFGWPHNDPKRQLGYKAYLIAWHARGNYDRMNAFYPYLLKATQQQDLPSSWAREYGAWLDVLKRVYQR